MSWGWPEPQNMVVAIGPGGTLIDIRHEGQYDRWHNFNGAARDGLTCLDCQQPVNPRRYHRDTPAQFDILAHSPQNDGKNVEERCAEIRKTNRGAGRKRILKELLKLHLVELGYRVETDVDLGGEQADLVATARSRRAVFRVELSKLPFEDAKTSHTAIQRATRGTDTDILWITFGCAWVDRLPAIGVRFFEEPVNGSVDLGGVHTVVDAGILSYNDPSGGLRQPEDDTRSLWWSIDQFMSRRLVHVPIDRLRQGWASRLGIRMQLSALLRRLTKARAESQELRETIRTQETTLAAERRGREEQRGRAERAEQQISTLQRELSATRADLDLAIHKLGGFTSWAEQVEVIRNAGLLNKVMLRNLPEVPDEVGTR